MTFSRKDVPCARWNTMSFEFIKKLPTPAEIRKELPEADAVCGIGADADIVEVVDRTLRGEHPELFPE